MTDRKKKTPELSSDAARIVLARRAKFIAAAIAGVGIACGEPNRPPQPCLSSPPQTPDAGPGPGPTMPGPPIPGPASKP
jgi:hypothetical protein